MDFSEDQQNNQLGLDKDVSKISFLSILKHLSSLNQMFIIEMEVIFKRTGFYKNVKNFQRILPKEEKLFKQEKEIETIIKRKILKKQQMTKSHSKKKLFASNNYDSALHNNLVDSKYSFHSEISLSYKQANKLIFSKIVQLEDTLENKDLAEKLRIIKQYLNQSIQKNPEDSRYYCNKANTLEQMNRFQEAVENYFSAIQKNPEDSDYYNGKAITLDKMNRFEEALYNDDSAIQKTQKIQDIILIKKLMIQQFRNFHKPPPKIKQKLSLQFQLLEFDKHNKFSEIYLPI
ncbi:unnamed protein product [Paramecium octaurelia]|uniref:Tetratricopeptide repeat protein n=1 Tax=Paramecium octaurelia TaxID=43137 RepID=A0A8S1UP44_PAROT|nr:unnamed protein product [Paramecium octaurelia]